MGFPVAVQGNGCFERLRAQRTLVGTGVRVRFQVVVVDGRDFEAVNGEKYIFFKIWIQSFFFNFNYFP